MSDQTSPSNSSFFIYKKTDETSIRKEVEVVTTEEHLSMEQTKELEVELSQKKKRKYFIKKFRKEWLEEPIFQDWLEPIPNNAERCYCRLCNVVLLAGHSELEKHACGKKHCENVNALQLRSQAIEEVCQPEDYHLVESTITGSIDDEEVEMISSISIDDIGTEDVVYQYADDGRLVTLDMAKLRKSQQLKRPTMKQAFPTSTSDKTAAVPNILKRKSIQITNVTPVKKISTGRIGQSTIHASGLPSKPDPQKLRYLDSDSDEDYDDHEDSAKLIREMRAELAYSEREFIDQKRRGSEEFTLHKGKLHDLDETRRQIAEKELDAKLQLIEEQRRHGLNVFKLQLFEMESKIKLAETQLQNSRELHSLRKLLLTKQLNSERKLSESA